MAAVSREAIGPSALRGVVATIAILAACGTAAPPIAPPKASAVASVEPLPEPSASVATLEPSASSEAPVASESAPPVEEPIAPITIEIPKDKKVYVVFAKPSNTQVFVYLHGKCGDPLAFKAFAKIIPAHGTFVAMRGDLKCGGGQPNWSDDIMYLDQRITKALDVVEAARGEPLDKDRRFAIGYSAGALRAESLGTRYPDRYPRVILIGGPRAPRQGDLGKSERILLMAGSLDVRKPLKDAAADFTKLGRMARFIEIPGAKHGEYGPQAEDVMTEALDWIAAANDP
jgi:predicted esterase